MGTEPLGQMPNGCQRPHPWRGGAQIEERRRRPCWWGVNAHILAQQGRYQRRGSGWKLISEWKWINFQAARSIYRPPQRVILPEQEDSRGSLRLNLLSIALSILSEELLYRMSIINNLRMSQYIETPPPSKCTDMHIRYLAQIKGRTFCKPVLHWGAKSCTSPRFPNPSASVPADCRSESPPIKLKPHPAYVHVCTYIHR